MTATLRLAPLSTLATAVLIAAPAFSQDSPTDVPPPGRLIDVGGYRLHLLCEGPSDAGAPTVVMSAGGGGFAIDWDLVQTPVAASSRVCSYDRANEGWSDLGPNPRTLRQEVFELHVALRAAGEMPPYVLVGQSLGGLVVREFARSYPDEVIGAVLVEPTHESARLGYRGELVRVRTLATGRPVPPPHTLEESPPVLMSGEAAVRCREAAASSTIFGPFANLPPPTRALRLWLQRHPKCHVLPEDFLSEELAEIHSRRQGDPQPLGDMPLIVIAGDRISVPAGVDAAEWRREKRSHLMDLARLSRNGRLLTDTLSGHFVHLDNPPVVIAAIREVIERATLARPNDVAVAQVSDSTYAKALGLGLPRLPPPVAVHYSRGHEPRAAALQRGARTVRDLVVDSVDVEPADVVLLVLDEGDWADVTTVPYGLHTLLEHPPVFLAPAQVDRGIYHRDDLPDAEAELAVDLVGLHYLAHFYAAEAIYEDGRETDAPVKWLDELFTLMLQEELLGAIDPELREAGRRSEAESLRLADPRVTTLTEFDREYRRYFVTRDGGANYAWFLARLARWSREIRRAHGIGVLRRVRDALAADTAEMDTHDGLRLLEAVGVDTGAWQEPGRGHSSSRSTSERASGASDGQPRQSHRREDEEPPQRQAP